MARIKAYRSINEIIDIFKITAWTVTFIVKKYKVDNFLNKWVIQLNSKDFYKAYTKNVNPSLFDIWYRKNINKESILPDIKTIFNKLFSTPYNKDISKRNIADSLWNAKNYNNKN